MHHKLKHIFIFFYSLHKLEEAYWIHEVSRIEISASINSGQPNKFEDQEFRALLKLKIRIQNFWKWLNKPYYWELWEWFKNIWKFIYVSSRQRSTLCRKSSTQIFGNAQMGCFTAPAVFIGHCSFSLLFRWMQHDLAGHRFTSIAELENWHQTWIASKDELPESWAKVVSIPAMDNTLIDL